MPREIRQLPLFPPPPPTAAEDAAIAALEVLKAIAAQATTAVHPQPAHRTSPSLRPQEAASGGDRVAVQSPTPPTALLGDSERADATVDRTYQHCPTDPQVWVTFPGGHCERLPVVAGWSDRRYVAAASAARASVFE